MHLSDDENGTCTQLVLGGFNYFVEGDTSFDSFKNKLTNLMDDYDDYEEYHVKDLALVTATTSSTQPRAEELLKQFGFKSTCAYASNKYKGSSKVTLWHMSAKTFAKKLK